MATPALPCTHGQLELPWRLRFAEVARTHAGRPQPEVLASLERTISGFGLQPNHPDVDDQEKRISDGNAEQP